MDASNLHDEDLLMRFVGHAITPSPTPGWTGWPANAASWYVGIDSMFYDMVRRMRTRGKRIFFPLAAGIVLSLTGSCLPNGYWSSLFANSLSAVTGVLLSDFLNIVIPPV